MPNGEIPDREQINRWLRDLFEENAVNLMRAAKEEARRTRSGFIGVEHLLKATFERFSDEWPPIPNFPPRDTIRRLVDEEFQLKWLADSAVIDRPIPTKRLARLIEQVSNQARNEGRRVTIQDILQALVADPWTLQGRTAGVRDLPAPLDNEWTDIIAELNNVSTVGPHREDLSRIVGHLGIRPPRHQFVGRDKELRELGRSVPETPVLLIGPPGVGKTELVKELARRLWREKSNRIVNMPVYALAAGAGIVGQMEARFTAIKAWALRHNIILFIDEFDTVIGTGAYLGHPHDLTNLLIQAIDGGLKVIGALTPGGYELVRDRAPEGLLQRFTVFRLPDLEKEEVLECFRAALGDRVSVDEELLDTTFELGKRFLHGQRQPAKGIRWLLQAARQVEGDQLMKEVLAQTVAREVNVPYYIVIAIMRGQDFVDEERLRESLCREVVGQEEAINRITTSIAFACAALGEKVLRRDNPYRPRAIYLFAGPPGTGKSMTAKLLAEHIFGKDALKQFDMSTYRGQGGLSQLLGDPPGVYGGGRGRFAKELEEKPCCVILLDEIDRTTPDIIGTLLPIFQEGRILSARGEEIFFSDAIIVLTTNRMPETSIKISDSRQLSAEDRRALKKAYEDDEIFHPALMDRIDHFLVFRELSDKDLEEIARRQIEDLNAEDLRFDGIEVQLEDSAIRRLARLAAQEGINAREVRRVIQDRILTPILNRKMGGLIRITVSGDTGKLCFETSSGWFIETG